MNISQAIKELESSDKLKIELETSKHHNKFFLRILYNKLIFTIQKKIIPSHFKNWLLRTTGMHVGRNACIPHDIDFDPYYPELIYVGRGCIIGASCHIRAHEKNNNKLTIGKVIIGPRTLLGGVTTVRPGSKIGKDTIVGAHSHLQATTGEDELWVGNPAKLSKKFSPEEIEKYFRPSNGRYKEYYKEFYQKIKAFKKDPSVTYLKIHYDGNRDNPGNDWWRARNVLSIFWSGAFIELARRSPKFIRNTLYRLAGAKIGKNVNIGKNVVMDHLMTPYITVQDNVILEDNVYLDGHSYTVSQTVFGRTIIKKGAHLKNGVFANIGTIVGENTMIEEKSAIQQTIPPNEIWGGSPTKKIGDRE